ncbi:PAS domain-containing protein [Aestuariispira insulae]|uniref:PAS domain-containing protein n=1 Tax=Aestuariispira insulae TaxID=1461337 RepID=A0A3D9HVI7_9PROT|nr:PAS domain-containing protein [Aestuariispira insulae]RED53425.1 PAS domain-containing protein [Aestuariispira insulae]
MKTQCFKFGKIEGGQLPAQESPHLTAVLKTWQDLHQAVGKIPRKSAFDPVNFPRSLPYCWLYEYVSEADDFLCRVSGSVVDEAWGQPIRDHLVGEFMPPDLAETSLPRMRNVINKPALLHIRRYCDTTQKPVEKLVLPLADENDRIRFVFGTSHYQYRPNRFEADSGDDFQHYYKID